VGCSYSDFNQLCDGRCQPPDDRQVSSTRIQGHSSLLVVYTYTWDHGGRNSQTSSPEAKSDASPSWAVSSLYLPKTAPATRSPCESSIRSLLFTYQGGRSRDRQALLCRGTARRPSPVSPLPIIAAYTYLLKGLKYTGSICTPVADRVCVASLSPRQWRLRCCLLLWVRVRVKEAAQLHAAVGAGIGGCCVLRLLLQWVQAKDAALLLAVVSAGEGGCAAAHLLAAVGTNKGGCAAVCCGAWRCGVLRWCLLRSVLQFVGLGSKFTPETSSSRPHVSKLLSPVP
jgi:hypothetical protein